METVETKKKVSKRVTAKKVIAEEKPNKKEPKKPDSPAEWLQSYITQGEQTTSAAKLATFLMSRKQGASMKELIKRCTELSEWKMSSWGKSRGSIKSHCAFLKQKGCTVTEISEDVYRVSA